MLDFLITGIRDYAIWTDEYSVVRHRDLFDAFDRARHEYRNVATDGLSS